MHPQRLLLDHVQGSEALPLLKLLFTMDGVMFSIVADSPKDAVSNLERMLLPSEPGLDMNMIRRILSSSLDMIIQLQRLQDGSARIVNLTEVPEAEDDTIIPRDIFLHQRIEEREDEPFGLLRPTGIKPQFSDRMEMLGISLPKGTFVSPHKKKGAAS
jgi:pilus assembly protein CpaF